MILRRFTKHVTDQNWFAVGLDVLVVVAGIFLGLQFTDWNEERTFYETETELLQELKRELEASILFTESRLRSFKQVADAGKQSLDFLSSGASCGRQCWPILVNFFHASQWQSTQVKKSTYENMRLLGLPRNRAIVDALEVYSLESKMNAEFFAVLPYYRSIVRQLIPLEIQEYYWDHCYLQVDGAEIYETDCPSGPGDDLVSNTVDAIVQHPDIKPHLTEWAGAIISAPESLGSQNSTALRAIRKIEEELERRQ